MPDHRHYLEIAVTEAENALTAGTYPIGAVLVGPDGEILAQGRNRIMNRGDVTHHAEIDVIRQAGLLLWQPDYKHRCTLYTSTEPCLARFAGAVTSLLDAAGEAAGREAAGRDLILVAHGTVLSLYLARLKGQRRVDFADWAAIGMPDFCVVDTVTMQVIHPFGAWR